MRINLMFWIFYCCRHLSSRISPAVHYSSFQMISKCLPHDMFTFFLPQRGKPWVRVCACVCISAGRDSWSTQAWVSHWRCQLALRDGKRAWVGSAVTSCPGRTSLPPSHFVSPSPPLRMCRRFIYLITRSPPARPLFISCLFFFFSWIAVSFHSFSPPRSLCHFVCEPSRLIITLSHQRTVSFPALCFILPTLPHTSIQPLLCSALVLLSLTVFFFLSFFF